MQCNVALSTGKVHSLIFGGQLDGDIVLIHSSKSVLSMTLPQPAHDSMLTMLVGASDVVPNTHTRSDGSLFIQSALVSYGRVSNKMHIWGIDVNESTLTLELQVMLIIKMTVIPRAIAVSGSTVCMAFMDNRVTMFRNRTIRKPYFAPQALNITSIGLLHHQAEDGHTHTITSLNVCPYLKLFVSSSIDGTIKVWSFDNQMVAEIDFGVPLTSVGFANDQGDLLVGLQLHISIIRAADYLPAGYFEMSRNCPNWDEKERPIAFDPHLEFWWVSDSVVVQWI